MGILQVRIGSTLGYFLLVEVGNLRKLGSRVVL
jgi:hypothetical protein